MEKDLTTYVKNFILKYSDEINNKNSDALLQALSEQPYLVHMQANTTIVKLCLSFGIPMDENLEVKSEGFELRINLYELANMMDGYTLKMDYSIRELVNYILDPYSSLKAEEFFTDDDLDNYLSIEYHYLTQKAKSYLSELNISEDQFDSITNTILDKNSILSKVLLALRAAERSAMTNTLETDFQSQAIEALKRACPKAVNSTIDLQKEELVLTGNFRQFATSYKYGDKLSSFDVAYNAVPFSLDYTHCLVDYLARRLDFEFDVSLLSFDERKFNDEFEKALLRLI